jgi:hypothetical protein
LGSSGVAVRRTGPGFFQCRGQDVLQSFDQSRRQGCDASWKPLLTAVRRRRAIRVYKYSKNVPCKNFALGTASELACLSVPTSMFYKGYVCSPPFVLSLASRLAGALQTPTITGSVCVVAACNWENPLELPFGILGIRSCNHPSNNGSMDDPIRSGYMCLFLFLKFACQGWPEIKVPGPKGSRAGSRREIGRFSLG